MTDQAPIVVTPEGIMLSACLHWEGFPAILWDVLRPFGYSQPPYYIGREYLELGTQRCHVQLTLLPTPMHPGWPILDVEVRSHRLADTWEIAALQALTQFCSQHP